MAGIDTLLKGAVSALAKDKVSPFLSPSQRDFLALILSPQGYLLDKGVNAAANALGYGDQYRELKGGAEGNKEYYKEVMRDTIGNSLPDSIGDFVRATPRISEADQIPAGTYTAFDPETQTHVQRESSNPVAKADPAKFEEYVRNDTYGTLTPGQKQYVGPLSEDNPIFENRVENLAYDLNSVPVSGIPKGLDLDHLRSLIFGANQDVGPLGEYDQTNLNNEYDFLSSLGEYRVDSNEPMGDIGFSSHDYGGGGGGGDRGDFDYSFYEMAKGGRIPRGKK
jgi:hypothetical protein